jgi:hypothetical protein
VGELFRSGRIIDLILAAVVLEGAILWTYRRVTGRGPRIAGLLANLASGACLLLALGLALRGAEWELTAAWLAAALLAHLADLRDRWD